MSYRAVLRIAGPGFVSLGFLARLPYTMMPLGTLILLSNATNSYTFAGLAVAAQSLATASGGPIVGALADRHGLRRIGLAMAVANLLAVLGLLAASGAGRTVMLVATAAIGLTQPQVGPLVRVHWSRVVRPQDLSTALSYETAVDEAAFIAGPALVGLLAPVAPIAPVASTSGLLAVATLPFAMRYVSEPTSRRVGSTVSSALLPRRALAAMALAMAALGAVFGAVQTGVTAYADSIGRPGASGLLYALLGVGSALAGIACGWLPQRFTPRQRYLAFATTLLAGTAPLAVGAVPLPVAVAILSVTIAPYMISLYTLTGRLAPPHRIAIAMTVLSAGGPIGTATGQALAGRLADAHGSSGAFLVVPMAAALAMLLAWWLLVVDHGRGIWLAPDPTRDLTLS